MSGELKTQGTELFILDETGSPQRIVKIGKLSAIDSIGGSASEIDITNFDSTAMEYMVGLIDNGTANLSINLDPTDASHQLLESIAGGDRYYWAVGFSDGSADPIPNPSGAGISVTIGRSWLTFQASVQQWQYGFTTNDAIRVSSSLRVTGAITLTPRS